MTDPAARILVVDDDAGVRVSLARVLTLEGHTVGQACSGAEAVSRIDRGGWDLVVLDLRMPKLGGLTVLQHVRRLHPAVPILVVTGYPTIDNAKESIQLGAFDFLLKPLDTARIREVVARALAHGREFTQRRC